jgi:hypothetical protein
MKPSTLPVSIDRMPLEARKPRAGPLLDPDEVIACALSMVPYRWSGRLLSESSIPVRAVLDGLHQAGYKIVPR